MVIVLEPNIDIISCNFKNGCDYMNTSHSKTHTITITALFAALTCISTMVIQIPSPTNGYIHPGDCFVLLSGWLLGPFYGFIASGLGGMLADLLTGYVIYAPATFLIKGIMSIIAYLILKIFSENASMKNTSQQCKSRVAVYLSGIISEVFMVAGYFLFSAVFLGTGFGALSGIPANAVQGIFAVVATPILYKIINKIHLY